MSETQTAKVPDDGIAFSIYQPMICASGDAEGRVYKLLQGKSGKRWVVAVQENAADNVYQDGGPGSDGMAGRTLTFQLEDGSSVDFIGPWKTTAGALFADTGHDVRGTTLVQGILAFSMERAKKWEAPDIYRDVIHYDETAVVVAYGSHKDIAQAKANETGREVFFAYVSKGGGAAGAAKPKTA